MDTGKILQVLTALVEPQFSERSYGCCASSQSIFSKGWFEAHGLPQFKVHV